MEKRNVLINTKMKRALFAKLSRLSKNILKRNIVVKDVEKNKKDALAYTSAKGTIHISVESDSICSLKTVGEQIKFARGLWVHELMHQKYTDFVAARVLQRQNAIENEVYHTIFNIVEDARIENFASNVIGGVYTEDEFDENGKFVQMSDLTFMKRFLYSETPPIGPQYKPYTQVLNAMNMYGNCGIVKGEFSDEQAKSIFCQIMPLFDKCVDEPNARTVVRACEEIAEMTRPLWEKNAKFTEEIKNLLNELGCDNHNANNSRGETPEGPPEGSNSASRNRKITRKTITASEANEMLRNGEVSTTPGNSEERDVVILDVKDPENLDESLLTNGKESIEDGSSTKINDASQYSELINHGNNPNAPSITEIEYNNEVCESEGCYNDVEDFIIPEEELTNLVGELETLIKIEDSKEKKMEDKDTPIDVTPSTSKFYDVKDVSVLNRNALIGVYSDDVYDTYNETISVLRPSIDALTKQFQRMFKAKAEEKIHKSTGRINIQRMNSGRITSRIFDKRAESTSPHDVAIFVCVDESGSMQTDNKSVHAKNACIGIAEMCEKLNIPIYIMGYTANVSVLNKSYEAVHNHYIKWINNKKTRLNLLGIGTYCSNFDGYSIRYATKLLSMRPETHKLLIVISDGLPAASKYRNNREGVEDTRMAAKEANRVCTAIGVAIGSASKEEAFKNIYGNNSLVVPDVSTLFLQLGKRIKRLIKEDLC